MNNTNKEVNRSARVVRAGDKVQHLGAWFLVTDASTHAELGGRRVTTLELEGYGTVEMPAINTVRAICQDA